jgi:hypothetical protein
VLPIPKTRRTEVINDRIDAASRWYKLDAAGETIRADASALADISAATSSQTEVRPRFRATVEKSPRHQQFAGYGPISPPDSNEQAAVAPVGSPTGAPPLYKRARPSMKRFFLASPLKFQLSCLRGDAVHHPVLREVRAHLGVDYPRRPARRWSPSPTA